MRLTLYYLFTYFYRPLIYSLTLTYHLSSNIAFGQHARALHIIYPPDSAKIFSSDSMFVFGNFSSRISKITVNGFNARIFHRKTFVAMIPLQPGRFSIDIKAIAARDTIFEKRSVYAPPYLLENPRTTLAIDTSFFRTFEEVEMRKGEKITLFAKGTPGARATFSIPGIVQNVRMKELLPRREYRWRDSVFKGGKPPFLPNIHGIYASAYAFPENAPLGKATPRFMLAKSNGDTVASSPGASILLRNKDFHRTAIVKYETVITDDRSDQPIPLFFPPGTRVSVIGRIGNTFRLALSKSHEAWIPANRIRFPEGSLYKMPGKISNPSLKSFPDKIRIALQLTRRAPFRIIQDNQPQKLSLLFFDAQFDSTMTEIGFDDNLISKTAWEQQEDEARVTFHFASKQQWGYRAFYEETTFFLEIKRQPEIGKTRQTLFQNLVIFVDPGHSPDDGSIGPTGLKEKDAASIYARILAKMLERRGAKVILTRGATDGINLSSRAIFADQAGGDLFISLHFNALPDGVSPTRSRGASTYYYHQQSLAFAEAVQKKLLQSTRLRDFGLYQKDLAVCRLTSMPAILLEPAFIMIPHEEQKIIDPEFQKRACQGIVQGVENFLIDARE